MKSTYKFIKKLRDLLTTPDWKTLAAKPIEDIDSKIAKLEQRIINTNAKSKKSHEFQEKILNGINEGVEKLKEAKEVIN